MNNESIVTIKSALYFRVHQMSQAKEQHMKYGDTDDAAYDTAEIVRLRNAIKDFDELLRVKL